MLLCYNTNIASQKPYIFKANGQRVIFNENKILSTCRRAGANKKTAQQILKKVRSQVYHGIRTEDIYQLVLQAILEQKDQTGLHHRYQLKDAIMRLGPSGFTFENYVREIIPHYGFDVLSVRSKVQGKCAIHEIDLVAIDNGKKSIVECKHASTRGSFIGLKVALYTHARFIDISPSFDGEVIVSNAKFSQTAKKYSRCIGQQVFSWRYPPNNSLEKMIERHKLYPVTILNLSSRELERFSASKIMLAKDLIEIDENVLIKQTGLNRKRIQNLSKLARQIILDF